jgi:predicted RNase H-like HicB family nuclease
LLVFIALSPYSEEQTGGIMALRYTYEMDEGFYVGYLDDYPEYPTQGENLKDFEENLLDIYEMIRDGTIETIKQHGVLETVE